VEKLIRYSIFFHTLSAFILHQFPAMPLFEHQVAALVSYLVCCYFLVDHSFHASFIMGNCLNGIDTTSRIQSQLLHRAARSGDFTLLKQLVDSNQFDINFFAGTYPSGTPLLQATSRDNLDCFVYLLRHGARLDHKSEENQLSTLNEAVSCGSLKVVRYLLEKHRVKVTND
jgi:hypothetical protein